MDARTEATLLQRCLELAQAGSTQLGAAQSTSPVQRYTDEAGFAAEMQQIFRRMPVPLVPANRLARVHDFVTVDTPRGSLLLTRTEAGDIRAFHNVCRHRGTRLVDEPAGSARRFVCPYHAWTYSHTGELSGIPHQDSCFPELDRGAHGLARLDAVERHGFVWVGADGDGLSDFLAGLQADLDWLDLGRLRVFASETRIWQCNWKLIAEGGLESYHFSQAHRQTIAPYFFNNLSIYDVFGEHIRSVLPRRDLQALTTPPPEGSSLRRYTHLTYALFPMTTFLTQADHVVWIHATPLAVDRTRIEMHTLVPADDDRDEHWQTNHQITCATLREDFALGESIQAGLASGANSELHFGRNESALAQLREIIDARLS